MISLNDLNKLYGTIYINSQMYLDNWEQKDFREFQKNFQKYLKFIMLKRYQRLVLIKK